MSNIYEDDIYSKDIYSKYTPHQLMSYSTSSTFKSYPIMLNCCKKSSIITTNDGNKFQKCTKCGKEWHAPKEPENRSNVHHKTYY